MYKIAHNVLVLKYPEKWKKKLLFAFEKKFLMTILTNFDLTQNIDFILTNKIYLNWLHSSWN